MSKDKDQEAVIEGFKKAKHFMIAKVSTHVAGMIMKQVLEIEDFPSEPEAIHALQEQVILKGLFAAHASAIDSAFNTVIKMVQEGVLVGDGEKARILAEQLSSQIDKPKEEKENDE